MDALTKAREAFINMIADAVEWEEQPDGDISDSGRLIDHTTYKLVTRPSQLDEFCSALGIERSRPDESIMDAIDRFVQSDPVGA